MDQPIDDPEHQVVPRLVGAEQRGSLGEPRHRVVVPHNLHPPDGTYGTGFDRDATDGVRNRSPSMHHTSEHGGVR
jgi:hypothetical protein